MHVELPSLTGTSDDFDIFANISRQVIIAIDMANVFHSLVGGFQLGGRVFC